MSDYVRYKGKIRKVQITECNLEEWYKEECERLELGNLPSYFGTYAEFFVDERYGDYVLIDGALYEILEKNRLCAEFDMFAGNENEDGTINYEVMYYNGGCGFSEAMEIVIDKIKEDN